MVAGKRRLLRMIVSFETSTKGNLLLDDEKINDLPLIQASYEPSVPNITHYSHI